jgi:signal transduction histidine kinase
VPVLIIAAVLDPLTDPTADLTDFGTWHNPLGDSAAAHVLSFLAFLGHIPLAAVVAVGAIAQLVHRWRRGGAFERQQLLLFASAVAVTIVAAPISLALGGSGWIFDVAALPLPFAIGFAVLARGLYDLRTAANRTLVWVILSVAVAGLYALAIAGFSAITHVDRSVSWLPWAAAGVVAVVFSPIRDVLQRAVNRVTFGRWDEPYDVLAMLGQRVEQTGDADRLLADVVTELEGLGLRAVSIRDLSGQAIAGGAVPYDDDTVRVPLSAYGELVGELCYRAPANPLRRRDRRLLDDLAGHLGGVLHAHRLTADLQRARERLVLAREEERRRLRRDLHDGLGPALAGHLLRLDVLAARVGPDSVAADEIDTLRTELRATISDVRRLVEGLRPPALDDLGLVGAIEQVTRRLTSGTSTAVSLDCAPLPPLSAATEVAAFRIVTEAVTNVTKHAAATCCRVSLRVSDGWLRVCVEDDGHGLVGSPDGGNGLQTMRERAAELRGRLRVTSSPDGVQVTAELPAPATAPASRRERVARSVAR